MYEYLFFFQINKGNFTGEPTNCFDLHLIGHYLNGYYLVKNLNGIIETVFCNFGETNKTGGIYIRSIKFLISRKCAVL